MRPFLLSLVLATLIPGEAVFAEDLRSRPRALEGVWAMSLQLRDCTTEAPLGPPFRSLLTFHRGGTVSESPGTLQFAPGQRPPAHGVWRYLGGNTFSNRLVAMVLFDTPPNPPSSPGFLAGSQIIDSKATLIDADHLTITATVQFLDLNGQMYRKACPAGTATRFK